jgi:hypothetical protein
VVFIGRPERSGEVIRGDGPGQWHDCAMDVKELYFFGRVALTTSP